MYTIYSPALVKRWFVGSADIPHMVKRTLWDNDIIVNHTARTIARFNSDLPISDDDMAVLKARHRM